MDTNGRETTDPAPRRPDGEALSGESLLDSLTACVAVLDGGGAVLFVNRAWRDGGGGPTEAALGGNYLAVCDAAEGGDAAEIAAGVRAVLAGSHAAFSREYPCPSEAGEQWFGVRVTPYAGPGPARAMVAVEEITERKETERALRESEARYQAIVESAPGMVYQFLLRPDGSYAFPFVSEGCRDIVGVGPDEIRGHPGQLLARISPEDRDGFDRSVAESAETLGPWKWEGRFTDAAGAQKWVEAASRPERLPDGSVLWTGVLMDVTARRRAEHVSAGQTAVLTRTLGALAALPDLDAFQGLVLEATAAQLGSPRTSLWLHDPHREMLLLAMTCVDGRTLAGALADHPAAARPLTAAQSPLWRELLQTRRPVVVHDVTEDTHRVLGAWLRAQGVRTVLAVPLLQDSTVIGLLSVSSTTPRTYGPEEIALAQTLAHQVTLAMRLTQLAEHEQRTAILQERNRMAREIHDTLAQGFTGIVLQLDAAEDALAADPAETPAALEHLARARTLARDSLTEARRSVRALRPRALEQQQLPTALRQMARRLTGGTGLAATVSVHGTPRPLPPAVEDHLLRIAQEALTNTLKHAGAAHAWIELTFEAARLRLRVADDGRGMASPEALPGGGFGLTGMRERAERVGGRLTVASTPGRGTAVTVEVPAPPGPRGDARD